MTSFEGKVPSFLSISYPTAYGQMRLQKVRLDGMGEFVSCDEGDEKRKGAMEMYALVNSMKHVEVKVNVVMNGNGMGDQKEEGQEKQLKVDLVDEEGEGEGEDERSVVCCC